jgi:alpha-ketoglutarate-dependent taurine dioxygenase
MQTGTASTQNSVTPFSIGPLSRLMGAAVTGLNLAKPLDDATRVAVLDAFLTYQLLVFRDQSLSKDEQVAFSQQFGELERHTLRNRGDNDHPQVHIVSNLNTEGAPSGVVKSTQWHSDKSFRPAPSMATILHAVTLPPDGGDTCFANMYAAYDNLSVDEKNDLDGLNVIHSWELSRENVGRKMSQAEKDDAPPMSHPLARKHPDTGRIALFIGTHASHIEGAPMDIGRKRIEALEAHATQQKFVYRHQWRPGEVLMWDNRCLLHRADPNFDASTHPRLLHRTCLRGAPTT